MFFLFFLLNVWSSLQEKPKKLYSDRFGGPMDQADEDSQILYVEFQEMKRELKKVKESERALIEVNVLLK